MSSLYKYKILILSILVWGSFQIEVKAQELQDYLQLAIANNPELQASYTEFEASMQQVPQMASLPDPTLTVSAFGKMIQTRVGEQEARFSLMQMFPWFGTLKAKENASHLMAEAKFQNYLDKRSLMVKDLKMLYAELYALNKVIVLKEENLKILDSYRELALSRFKSGSAPMVNVVKIDIQRDAALTEIELLKESILPLAAEFNLLLNRDEQSEISIQDTLRFDPILLDQDQGISNHPSLERFDKQQQAFDAQGTIAQKEGFPMIGLGVDYSIISKRMDGSNPMGNGEDAVMPMLSVTLPIFRKKYKAAVKEAEFMAESMGYERKAKLNELKSQLANVKYELLKAEKLISLYDRQLENSAQANKLYISAFSNATGDFEEVLDMNSDILMLQTEQIEAIATGFKAQAKLEYLLFNKTE